jgi:hypothetical protein
MSRACRHHYPGGIAGCMSRSLRRRRRPSPLVWRVGSHIDCFEACSVFTRVAARTVRCPPYGAFSRGASDHSSPPDPPRVLPAGARVCRPGFPPGRAVHLDKAHTPTWSSAACAPWPSPARTRCLPARTIGLQNTADHPCQGEWVRIAACHHALYGQVVRVLHREWHDGVQLVVEGPDGKRCRLPLTWTDAAAEACLPTLLFAPGALRALVRLVRFHRSSAPQQACHASQQPDAAVEQLPGRNARSDDLALGRSPAPLAGEPRAPGGDAA